MASFDINSHQGEIAETAYYLWLNQGLPEGNADAHWYEAEAEVRVKYSNL